MRVNKSISHTASAAMGGFLMGMASLIYQVYGIRVLFFFHTESIASVSIGVATFILGMASGSMVVSCSKAVCVRPQRVLFLLAVAAALYGYFILQHLLYAMQAGYFEGAVSFIVPVMLLFVPGFLHGAAFPLLLTWYVAVAQGLSQRSAQFYAIDTLGAVVGCLLSGVLLIPDYGMGSAVLLSVLINILFAMMVASRFVMPFLLIIGAAVSVDFYVALSGAPVSAAQDQQMRLGRTVFERHSDYGTVRVGEDAGGLKGKGMFIDGRPMCHSGNLMPYQQFSADLARLLPANGRVLVIGLGCGFLLDAVTAQRPDLTVELYEINSQVVAAAREVFAVENHQVLARSGITLHVADGKQLLQQGARKRFDAVIIDIEEPSIIHSSPFYTDFYMRAAAKLLKPDGFYGIWAVRSNPRFGSILRNTVRAAFPQVYVATYGEFIGFYGAMQDTMRWDYFSEKQLSDGLFEASERRINSLEHNYLSEVLALGERFQLRPLPATTAERP